MSEIRRYSELINLKTFEERYEYLKIGDGIGTPTFGGHRYLNQKLYKSKEWAKVRRDIILRDNGFDLAFDDYTIYGKILIHHLNPLDIDDIINMRDCVFDPENLICVSLDTHNAIHYGSSLVYFDVPERTKNDTCPWKA